MAPVRYLHQLYTASDTHYTGKVSVPVLWDRIEGRIVNNESADIIRLFNSQFDSLTGNHEDYYPLALRSTIDEWNELIYHNINNGVYKTGFAKTQEHYENAVTTLFDTLDRVEAHLATNRYIAGDTITEADWRLFVTLVRFDMAYHVHSNAISAALKITLTCRITCVRFTSGRASKRWSISTISKQAITVSAG